MKKTMFEKTAERREKMIESKWLKKVVQKNKKMVRRAFEFVQTKFN